MHQFNVHSSAFGSIRWLFLPWKRELTAGPTPGSQQERENAKTPLLTIPIK